MGAKKFYRMHDFTIKIFYAKKTPGTKLIGAQSLFYKDLIEKMKAILVIASSLNQRKYRLKNDKYTEQCCSCNVCPA